MIWNFGEGRESCMSTGCLEEALADRARSVGHLGLAKPVACMGRNSRNRAGRVESEMTSKVWEGDSGSWEPWGSSLEWYLEEENGGKEARSWDGDWGQRNHSSYTTGQKAASRTQTELGACRITTNTPIAFIVTYVPGSDPEHQGVTLFLGPLF